MPLQVVLLNHDGRHIVAASGDLDLVTAPDLTELATDLIDAGTENVIVDISGLDFCDSSGLSAFVSIANRLEPDGRLALAGPQPIVRRVLDVSGLSEVFVITDTVGEAVAALV